MSDRQPTRASAGLLAAVATEWRELGWVGRVGLGGIAVALVLTVALGFFIVESSRRHLLDGRTDLMQTITTDLADRGVIPEDLGNAAGLERLEEEVNLRLLGGETVRVKLWTPDGTIAYSSGGDLTGEEFELSDLAERAFAGEAASPHSMKMLTRSSGISVGSSSSTCRSSVNRGRSRPSSKSSS